MSDLGQVISPICAWGVFWSFFFWLGVCQAYNCQPDRNIGDHLIVVCSGKGSLPMEGTTGTQK